MERWCSWLYVGQPRTLLNTLLCGGQPATTKNYLSWRSMVPRMRNSEMQGMVSGLQTQRQLRTGQGWALKKSHGWVEWGAWAEAQDGRDETVQGLLGWQLYRVWVCVFPVLLRQCNGKEPAWYAGDSRDLDSTAGSGRSPRVGNGNPFQYSGKRMERGAWRATARGVTESDMT